MPTPSWHDVTVGHLDIIEIKEYEMPAPGDGADVETPEHLRACHS